MTEAEAPKQKIPSCSPEELRKFVEGVLDHRIFLLQELPPGQPHLVSMVFMPLAFGIGDVDPEDVGTVWEYMDRAGPSSVNGYPCFFSLRFMNKADWSKAFGVLREEAKRRAAALDGAFEEPSP